MSPLLSRLRFIAACIFLLSFAAPVLAVSNDMFANATDLGSVTSAELSYRTENATRQAGEPGSGSQTVWWRWTAPSNGALKIACDEDPPHLITLYTGTALNALTAVPTSSHDDLTEIATVTAGTTYHLTIGGSNGTGTIRLTHFTPPTNDAFANRTHLGSALSFQAVGWTHAASREAGEPAFDVQNGNPCPSVWWSWQAPQDGFIRLDLVGSPDENFGIGIYTGNTLAGLSLRYERPANYYLTTTSIFRARAGETLAIAASRQTGFSTWDTGEVRLNWTFTPQTYQDTAADAVDLGNVMSAAGSVDNTGAPAMWWKWTAPIDGIARFSVPGDSTYVSIFDNNLVLRVGSASATAGNFHCEPGSTYYIRLTTSSPGAFAYQFSVQPTAANDDLANAAPLNLGTNPFTSNYTSVEATEPYLSSSPWAQSMWWQWTAPTAGVLSLEWQAKPSHGLRLYQVAENGTLSLVTQVGASTVLNVTPSQRYLIGVVSWVNLWASSPVTGSFNARFLPAQTTNDAFADAIDLGNAPHFAACGDPTSATVEAGEPIHNSAATPRSLWWKWTAPFTGYLAGSSPSGLQAYRGATLSTLTPSSGLITAGEVIYFAVIPQTNNTTPQVTFEFDFYPAATNDARANAIDLGTSTTFEFPVTLDGSTIEPDEPPHSFSAARSLWWKWTAPADLNIVLDLWLGAERGPGTADIYQVEESGALTLLPGLSSYDDARIPLKAGKTYYFSLISAAGAPAAGTFRMLVSEPPPGDRYDQPIDLGSVSSTTLSAGAGEGTREPQDPGVSSNYFESFWWKWTAPAAGVFTLSFEFTETLRILRENTPGNWAEVTSPVTVQSGQAIRVVGFTSSSPNNYVTAYLRFGAFPANDLRANATDLGSAATVTANSQLRAAYVEAGEDAFFTGYPSALTGTVWWTWTAPFNGALRVNALADATSTALAILSGPTAAGATLGASVFTTNATAAETIVPVTAGTRYWFMAGSRYATYDEVTTLTLEAWPTAPNDHWQAATDLGSADHAQGAGRSEYAIRESFEPAGQYRSVWWKWTAPRTGNAIVSADVSNSTTEVISVYRDTGAATPVAVVSRSLSNPSVGKMSVFRAVAGVTYYLSVATTNETSGRTVTIGVDFTDHAPNDDFASATPIPGALPQTLAGNARASTLETGEETATGGASLWWTWTAPASGRVLATVNGGAGFSVYTGSALGSLTTVASESALPWLAWQVTAGVTYRIRTIGEGPLSLRLESITPPANDHFANRQQVGITNNASLTGHNFQATAETSEPLHFGTTAARSIWYRWTPASTGRFEIDARASGVGMNVAVYRGTSLTALTPVTSGSGRVAFNATVGLEYIFAIDSGKPAPVSIEIRPSSVPANDNFANRIVVSGKSFALIGDSFSATLEVSEPLPGSSTLYPRTLWWEWTAPMTGLVQFALPYTTVGAPVIRAYTSANASPTLTNLSGSTITQSLSAVIGSRYFIQVVFPQSTPASGGPFRLEGSYYSATTPLATVTPPNDRFASWTDIGQALGVEITGDVLGSTLEPGQSGTSVGSIGWKWTAPSSGWFATQRQGPSATIRVLRGTTWSTLTTVASGIGTYVWFPATAGESLWIEWQSSFITQTYLERRDRFTSFQIIPANGVPANDAFAAPQALPAELAGTTPGTTVLATAEAGEPMHAGTAATRSVWYQWTATATGAVDLSATSATMRAAVYTGDTLGTLATVASGNEPLVFNAVAGTTYRIALDSATPTNFSLTLREAVPAVVAPNDHFANSTALSGPNGSTPATLQGATIEAGEPFGAYSSHSGSTWWHWTAPADGPVTWLTSSSSVHVSVYTGNVLGELNFITSNSGILRLHAIAGTTYRICTSAYSGLDFTLSWQQETTAPANDHFANAVVLPTTPLSVTGTLQGSSREAGEPRHASDWDLAPQGSVWYAWTAPANGVFTLTAEGAAPPTVWVYQNGTTLEQLDAIIARVRTLELTATAGVTYHIAVVARTATEEQPFQLGIEPKNYGDNDHFANRTHLGSASLVTWEGTTALATQEPGEPNGAGLSASDGTRWWSWTAPSNGAAMLRRIEPDSQIRMGIYTGTSLLNLTEIDATFSNFVAFPVTAGTTYHFQIGYIPLNFRLELSTAALEHDHFEDPLLLTPSLPVTSAIPATGASTQTGETTNTRTVWRRWVAPADGWVDLDYGASDFTGNLWVGQGNTLPHLTPVTLTTVASRVRRFFATAGTTYSISYGSTTEQSIGMARLTISAASDAGPVNDHFAAALPLTGETLTLPVTSRGATVETDEQRYLSSTHSRSLWWTWTAPRNGIVTVRAGFGWNLLYQGNALTSLVPVSPLGGVAGIYPVTAGQSYRIAAGLSAGDGFSLELMMSPPGDLFAQRVMLSPVSALALASTITGCSYEAGEPFHHGMPATRSRWFRWTAPASGIYRIAVDAGESPPLRLAAYTGSVVSALTPQAQGSKVAFLTATAGQTYHIAVDTNGSGVGDDFTLSITLEPAAYTGWRNTHFAPEDPDGGPDSDPDGDGRANLIELALGSDPLSHDSGALFLFTTTPGPVHLQVRHPSGLEGWHLSFDVSPALTGWLSSDMVAHTRWTEDHGDGTSTLHVTLTGYDPADFSTLFFRLRVEEEAP